MISKGVDPDAVIYCTLIEGLCKEGGEIEYTWGLRFIYY